MITKNKHYLKAKQAGRILLHKERNETSSFLIFQCYAKRLAHIFNWQRTARDLWKKKVGTKQSWIKCIRNILFKLTGDIVWKPGENYN